MATTDPTSVQNQGTSTAPRQQPYGEAFERVKAEADALEVDDLVRITVQIAKAGIDATGAIPRMMAHREAIATELPSFDIGKLDKLPDYAAAMVYVDATAAPPKIDGALQALLDEGTALKDKLLAVSTGLGHVGLLDANKLAQIRKGTGHHDMVTDLVALADMYRAAWSSIEGKCLITAADVERAGALGGQLASVVGPKNTRDKLGERVMSGPDADRRARVFTLFIDAYEECRAAIGFIRRKDGDVESIAPSVFVRARRKSSKATAEADTLVSGVPASQASSAQSGDVTD
jgi:hypothetical protein